MNRRYSAPHADTPQAAFASSNNWTNVQNPVKRRKIQNRVAQRNYRLKIKSKLEELERGRSGSLYRGSETANTPAIKSASEAPLNSSTSASLPSTQPRFESAQHHSSTLWEQQSGVASLALPPASRSVTMLPALGWDSAAQSGCRALCAQCSRPLLLQGTSGSPNVKYDAWASLVSQGSSPFDEGYAAMNRAQ